jgi:hypothetical protein
MTATHDFRSRSSVDALWDAAINKMGMHMVLFNLSKVNSLKQCAEPDLFLNMKQLIHSFVQTMGVYGYASLHLNDILYTLMGKVYLIISDRFGELTKKNHDDIISKMLEQDNHDLGAVVKNQKDLYSVLNGINSTDPTVQMLCNTLPFLIF